MFSQNPSQKLQTSPSITKKRVKKLKKQSVGLVSMRESAWLFSSGWNMDNILFYFSSPLPASVRVPGALPGQDPGSFKVGGGRRGDSRRLGFGEVGWRKNKRR